jgi:hypothetical protein
MDRLPRLYALGCAQHITQRCIIIMPVFYEVDQNALNQARSIP